MPNWKVHLEIAKRLNEKFKYTENQLEEFNLGNILPDINNCFIVKDISKKFDHKYTHYQDAKEIPSYENFSTIYKNEIYKQPLILGYYIHLYTDYTWNNYFYTNFKNDKKIKDLTHEEQRIIKQDDFKVYNNLFLNNIIYFTDKNKLVETTKKIDRVSINEEDLKKVQAFLKKQKKFNQDFKVLSLEILDKMMNITIQHFENNF